MKPPFPSPTETWHNASYDTISPSRPALSVSGKTVVVTGGGRGIGVEIARAYAAAGASRVVLLGRTESSLAETAAGLQKEYGSASFVYYVVDVADEGSVRHVAERVKSWDVLVLNAGLLGERESIEESDPSGWWRVFETNVKGTMLMTHTFLPFRSKDAAIVGISANAVTLPASNPVMLGHSAYTSSKFAQIRLLEHVAAENPDVFVVSVHPGVVESDMLKALAGGADLDRFGLDDANLPAHFLVWVVSKEAKFLRGKYVCANWDVEELKGKAKEIESTDILTANIHGWPYT